MLKDDVLYNGPTMPEGHEVGKVRERTGPDHVWQEFTCLIYPDGSASLITMSKTSDRQLVRVGKDEQPLVPENFVESPDKYHSMTKIRNRELFDKICEKSGVSEEYDYYRFQQEYTRAGEIQTFSTPEKLAERITELEIGWKKRDEDFRQHRTHYPDSLQDQEIEAIQNALLETLSDEELQMALDEEFEAKKDRISQSIRDSQEFLANGGDPKHLIPLDQNPRMSDLIAKSREVKTAEIEEQVGPRNDHVQGRDTLPDPER